MVPLPAPRLGSQTSLEATLRARRSVREFVRQPLALADISQLLWAAQGLTDSDGRRTAPSAGGLYPLEVFLVTGQGGDLPAGIYRFQPRGHAVVLLARGDKRPQLSNAALGQDWMADAPIIIVLAAVYERLAGKYRERAVRYALMEVGHAAQNVHLQAVALGLGTVVVGAFEDAEVQRVLSLEADEQPLCLMPVGKRHP